MWSSALRALIAPDSFKGTFGAQEVAAALARGCESAGVEADLCPVADGGEGTADALLTVKGGERVPQVVDGPLGSPTKADVVLLGDGSIGVVEVAAASGLAAVAAGRRDPLAASTRGTGELILDAFELGAREVIVAAGGSATTDGGRGAIEVLEEGREGRRLPLTVLCDVETTWESCAATYGPQKGADAGQVLALADRLDALAVGLPRDPRGLPMGGAAGGLSGGLWAAFGARLLPGAPFVLRSLDVDARLVRTGFAVTGEGRLDDQSSMGKLVGELARLAASTARRLHVVTGSDGRRHGDGPDGLASVTEARTLSEVEAAGREIALTELLG